MHCFTFSIAAGQEFPVASTGISSYLSKLIPVFVPENSSLQNHNITIKTHCIQNHFTFLSVHFWGAALPILQVGCNPLQEMRIHSTCSSQKKNLQSWDLPNDGSEL